jgi:predicted dehydrogenase
MEAMKSIGRREFVTTSLGAAAAVAATPRRVLSASDRVRLGIIGVGGRGTSWVRNLARQQGVSITALCDVDATRFERATEILDSAGQPAPNRSQDFRKILDDPNVDAVLVATNHHWMGLITILACQAGKDVYVEKPGSHNAREARKIVEAARKYDRVVQVGVQNRSAPYLQEAREHVRSGSLGDLHLVRVLSMNEGRIRAKRPDAQAPPTMDWSTWCGPAPLTSYSPGTWHVNRFDYGVGRIVDDLIHQVDVMVDLTGLGAPRTVVNSGGIYHFKDGREWPDTQLTTFEYPDLTLLFQSTLWADYIRETPSVIRDGDQFPNWIMNGTKIELFGTKGMMLAGRHGGGYQVYDNDRKMIASSYGRRADDAHMANFLECVRSRKRPIADVEDVYPSMLLCHLGNVSWRAGNRKLGYDARTGWIEDDPEANKFMSREGREPWTIPDEV